MTTDVIKDRGRGPRSPGRGSPSRSSTSYFLDPTATEEYIGRVHGLTSDEVAAAEPTFSATRTASLPNTSRSRKGWPEAIRRR